MPSLPTIRGSELSSRRAFTYWDQNGVREFRRSLALSQRTFAILVGVNDSTVERWEAGTVPPSARSSRKLTALSIDHKNGTLDLEFLLRFKPAGPKRKYQIHRLEPQQKATELLKQGKPLRCELMLNINLPPQGKGHARKLRRRIARLQVRNTAVLHQVSAVIQGALENFANSV